MSANCLTAHQLSSRAQQSKGDIFSVCVWYLCPLHPFLWAQGCLLPLQVEVQGRSNFSFFLGYSKSNCFLKAIIIIIFCSRGLATSTPELNNRGSRGFRYLFSAILFIHRDLLHYIVSFMKAASCVSVDCCLVAKSCLTLCDPMDYTPVGSSVHDISQARIWAWIAVSFFQGIFLTQRLNPHLLHWQADSLPLSTREAHVSDWVSWLLSHVSVFETHGLYAARQAPLSMEFSRQEYWSG